MKRKKERGTKSMENREAGYSRVVGSNFWGAAVLSPLRVRIVQGLRVSRASTSERRIVNRCWERGGVGWVIHHLWWAHRRSRRARRVFVLGVLIGGWVAVVESVERCSLRAFLLHDEPDDECGDYTESGETSDDASGDGSSVRTSFLRGARRKGTGPGARAATTCRTRVDGGYGGLCSSRFR